MIAAWDGAFAQLRGLFFELVLAGFGFILEISGVWIARQGLGAVFAEQGALQLTAGDQRVFDVQQVNRIEHAADARQLHLAAHIVRPADADILGGDQAAGFRSFLLTQQGNLIGCGRFQRARQLRRARKIAVGRQTFQYFGVFQYLQGFGIHGWGQVT